MNFLKGSSSLLFGISALFALAKSENLPWKIFNCWLPIISFLCNASGYEKKWLLMDYAVIIFLCISYVNEPIVTWTINVLCIVEILADQNIVITKNAAYLLAITKGVMISSFFFQNTFQHYTMMLSMTFGFAIYSTRFIRYRFTTDDSIEYVIWTWGLHACVAIMLMCFSCLAVKEYDYSVYLF